MGEANRRKRLDPEYGNTRKENYQKDSLGLPTIRYFKVEGYDGEHYELSDPSMLITRPFVLNTRVWVECDKVLQVGTEIKGYLKDFKYGSSAIPQFVPEEINNEYLQKNHVQAKNLNHIGIKGSVHLWHVVNNVWKSLTNSAVLELVEQQKGFEVQILAQKLAQYYHFKKADYINYPDGFVYIDHLTEKSDFIASNGWTEIIEQYLLKKGFLQYKTESFTNSNDLN